MIKPLPVRLNEEFKNLEQMVVQVLFIEQNDELSLELKCLKVPYDSHPKQILSMSTKQEVCIFHQHLHNQEQLAQLQLLCTE